jgi:hypothetical protein
MSTKGIRFTITLVLFLFCLMNAMALTGSSQEQTGNSASVPIQVVVDTKSAPVSTFQGLGAEIDPYDHPPSPDQWKRIQERLEFSRFGLIRIMSSAYDYCEGFDAKGNPVYVWNTPDDKTQKHLDRMLTLLDFAQAHNITVYLGEWLQPGRLGMTLPDDPRWTRLVSDFVDYLIHQKHYTVIKYYILMNEPNGQWMWHATKPNYNAWAKGVRQLRKDFDAHGLTSVQIAGPDNSGDEGWFSDSVHDLAPQIGAWESHIYAKDEEIFSDSIELNLNTDRKLILKVDRAGAAKPRIIGEVGGATGKDGPNHRNLNVLTFPYGVVMSDFVAQIIRAGWTGASAWELDDGMHVDSAGIQHIWGFWDSSDKQDMNMRPWFYTWSFISRGFPKGASILKVDSSPAASRFRATAAAWNSASDKETSVLLVNDADAARTVVVHAPEFASRKLYNYHFFENDRPVDAKGLPIPASTDLKFSSTDQGLTINMPSRGVVLLTTSQP